ncbi:protein of unknown function DUF389 [Pseudodesulfovibrio mercurii]|uniref:TIGR00341 family protein n=1 Tax=Pseudodesulfovibrio mercurii TaxID=641491 RepID=F0JBR5_9BACT|nr:TIGR00341 family protein [Pseudodesulfovibrio mercurii]EGB15568.1 protein of unknown function DUF389 [Pseudodesulfovibrio mercurii]
MATEDRDNPRGAGRGTMFERLYGIVNDYTGGRLIAQLTPERFGTIWRDIVTGSEPAPRYYIMVVVSTLIAEFGLLSNSTAVVIGAMLVAPLMTPIFGISLGLVRGNTRLIRKALKSEVQGVLIAVGMGLLVGGLLVLIDPAIESTPEMLARTKPNLFDLIVALLAGFAGAYAIVDEKISPALPGVAIATAIVPPLANCGLCLAYGLYAGALGSFLLFTANFLSIHLISALLFFRVGMARDYGEETRGVVVKRFGPTFVLFVAIAVTFAFFLFDTLEERKVYNEAYAILSEELSDYAATGIDGLEIHQGRDGMSVLARIYSTGDFDPNQVGRIEARLGQSLDRSVHLVVRAIRTADISARGADVPGLNKALEGTTPSFRMNLLRITEQVVREFLADRVGLDFEKAEYLHLPNGAVVAVSLSGLRGPSGEEIRAMEERIRNDTQFDALRLLIRYTRQDLFDDRGPIRSAWTTWMETTEAQRRADEEGCRLIAEWFQGGDSLLVTRVNGVIEPNGHTFLVEAEGTGEYRRETLAVLRDRVGRQLGTPVTIYVWLNHGVVLTEDGLVPYNTLLDRRLDEIRRNSGKEIRELLDSSR